MITYKHMKSYQAAMRESRSLGFPTRCYKNRPVKSPQNQARGFEILAISRIGIVLYE